MRDVLFDFHPFCCLTWNFSKFKIRIWFSSSIVQVGQYGPLVVASEECCGDIVGKPKSQTSQIIKPSNYGLVTFQRSGHLQFFQWKGPKNFKGFPREPRLNHQPFGTTNCHLFGIDCLLVSALGTLDRGTTSSFRRSLVSRCFSLELRPSPLSSTFNAVVWDGLFIGIACRVLWDGSSDLKN